MASPNVISRDLSHFHCSTRFPSFHVPSGFWSMGSLFPLCCWGPVCWRKVWACFPQELFQGLLVSVQGRPAGSATDSKASALPSLVRCRVEHGIQEQGQLRGGWWVTEGSIRVEPTGPRLVR